MISQAMTFLRSEQQGEDTPDDGSDEERRQKVVGEDFTGINLTGGGDFKKSIAGHADRDCDE